MTYNSQSIIFYKFWKSKKKWKWQWREKNIFRDLQVFTLVKSRSWTADPLNCRNSFGEVRWWSSNDLATCLAPPGSRRERGGGLWLYRFNAYITTIASLVGGLHHWKLNLEKLIFLTFSNSKRAKWLFSISPRMDL